MPKYHAAEDAACIGAVLSGRRERFEELVARYQNAVFSIVLGYVKDRHRAEDVAQDVFVNAFTALPQLRDPHYFLPWLLQIARHKGSHATRRPERPPDVPLLGIERAEPETDDTQQRIAGVLGCVEQLPEPYRQTVLLKYMQDLSCKEIAEKEGVAVGTITSRLTRALTLLRTALAGEKS